MYRIDAASASQLPRERLQHLGAEQLSNQELLAILLRTGTKQLPVSALSQQILKQINRLSDLEHLSLQELQQIDGIGVVKSIEIKAMIELSKRIFKDVCLPHPSESDVRFTEKIKTACEMIGICCLDHIIVGKYRYYSFREEEHILV